MTISNAEREKQRQQSPLPNNQKGQTHYLHPSTPPFLTYFTYKNHPDSPLRRPPPPPQQHTGKPDSHLAAAHQSAPNSTPGTDSPHSDYDCPTAADVAAGVALRVGTPARHRSPEADIRYSRGPIEEGKKWDGRERGERYRWASRRLGYRVLGGYRMLIGDGVPGEDRRRRGLRLRRCGFVGRWVVVGAVVGVGRRMVKGRFGVGFGVGMLDLISYVRKWCRRLVWVISLPWGAFA